MVVILFPVVTPNLTLPLLTHLKRRAALLVMGEKDVTVPSVCLDLAFEVTVIVKSS